MAPVTRCNICSKEFKHECNMYRHKKSVHGTAKFSCKYCNKRYGRLDDLKLHERKKHQNTLATVEQTYNNQLIDDFLESLEISIITNQNDGLPRMPHPTHHSWQDHTPPAGMDEKTIPTEKILFAAICVVNYWWKHGGTRPTLS